MKSLPYNAIVTKSPRLLDRLFFPKNRQRSSLDNFLKDLDPKERDNMMVLSPGGGYGFLELDVNFPEGGGSKYITLKLVESSELVDYFALDRHPIDHITESRIRGDETFSEQTVDSILRSSSRFFLSFGAGDDIRTWSGPYSMTLQNAKLTVASDGVRQIELFFVPSFDSIKSFTSNMVNDGNYGQLESTFDSKMNKYQSVEVDVSVGFDVIGAKSKRKWNWLVRALMREYIAAMFTDVPRDNILLLFPTDLDRSPTSSDDKTAYIKLPSYTDRSILDHAENLSKFGIQISPIRNTPIPKPPKKNTSKILQNITNDPNAIVDTGNESQNLSNPQEFIPGESDDERSARLARQRKDLGIEIKGLTVSPGLAKLSDAEVNKLNQAIGDNGISTPVVVVPEVHQNPDHIVNQDTDFSLIKKAKIYISKTLDNTKKFDSFLGPLHHFYRGIRRRRNKNVEFTLFEEADMKIKRFLKESNIIADPNATVIVFGEKATVQQLMYPLQAYDNIPKSQDFSIKPDAPSDKAVKELGKVEAEKKALEEATQNTRSEVGFDSTLSFTPLGSQEWVKYSKSFADEFYGSIRGRTSSYGEKIDFGPFSKLLGDKLNNTDLVFMHNVKNSNVLDVSFENAGYIASLISLSADSKLQTAVLNKKGDQILSDNRIGLKDITNYLSNKLPKDDSGKIDNRDTKVKILEMLRKDKELQKLVYTKGIEDTKVIDFLDVIFFLILGDALPRARPKVMVEPGDRYRVYSDMLEDLCKFTIKTEIKTLPFFNHPQLFDRKCYLFGLDNRIIGSRLSPDNPYSVFTGRYKIIGARHFLSNNDAYSKFKLVKVDATGNRVDEVSDMLNVTLGEFIGSKPTDIKINDMYKDFPFGLGEQAKRFEKITGESFIPTGSKL